MDDQSHPVGVYMSPADIERWQQVANRHNHDFVVMVTGWTEAQHPLSALCKVAECEWAGTFSPQRKGG